ncbi:MAG TPA: sugar phosphate nucleotidyltransferase [Candidatus Acidoferrales bacterium]|nr:sugar phosphate nucleotidyltransferase [Candidatus Acidoferrales bacterium]
MTSTTADRGVIILAGGRGERFWPWSTAARPKQLLPLASGGRTLLRATFERALRAGIDRDRIAVITSQDLREACQHECPGVRIYGEPMMRNTAPAIAAASSTFGQESALAVLPSDHAIDDETAFAADLERAFALAAREAVLVTFGIRPRAPETNFGYLHLGARLAERLHRVAQFKEKPDRATAEVWVASGEYLWNSGMFVWGRRTFFDALRAFHPEIAALESFGLGGGPEAFAQALKPRFEPLPSISVDYAVLEHAPNVVTIEAAFDWDDLGSWGAWARRQPRDARGNVTWGSAVPVDCDGCVVVGDGIPAAPLGLRDMVVVATPNGTLACRIEDSDQVRRATEAVRARAAS